MNSYPTSRWLKTYNINLLQHLAFLLAFHFRACEHLSLPRFHDKYYLLFQAIKS
jgi:hypothetical protein